MEELPPYPNRGRAPVISSYTVVYDFISFIRRDTRHRRLHSRFVTTRDTILEKESERKTIRLQQRRTLHSTNELILRSEYNETDKEIQQNIYALCITIFVSLR